MNAYAHNVKKKAGKPERNENRGPSRAKFDMLTFDDEFCFGLRDYSENSSSVPAKGERMSSLSQI